MVSSIERVPGADVEEPDGTAALLRRIAVGDRAAFLGLYDRVSPAVYAVARRRRSETAAAALLQEVFLRLWSSAPLFVRQDLTAEAWILALVSRSITD